MVRRIRWLGVTAACIALALGAAACGSGDGGGDAGSTTAGGDGGTTAIKVQETAGVPSAFVDFGIDKGFFEDQGLDVQLEAAQGGAATIPALMGGDVQIGGSGVVSLLIAVDRGLPLQAIAPGTGGPPADGRDWSALMVKPDSPIKDVKDLEGKTISVNVLNNVADLTVKEALAKQGVDVSTLRFIEVPLPETLAAVENGDVDAGFSIEPFVTQARAAGVRVISHPYVESHPDMQVGAYATTREYAAENPDVVRQFQAGVAATAAYIAAHDEEFREFLVKRGRMDPRAAREMALPVWFEELNVESMEQTAEMLHRHHVTDDVVPVSELLPAGG